MKSDTIARLFQERVQLSGSRLAIKWKVDGEWEDVSWEQYGENVKYFALGLLSLGLDPRTAVSILGYNSPQWVFADVGAMSAGAVTVPIYHTNTPEQVRYILDNSDAKFVVTENKAQTDKVLEHLGDLPAIEKIIAIDMDGVEKGDVVMAFDDVLEMGKQFENEAPSAFQDRIESVRPEDLATIIYTSGTTGPPKGTMLTHANIIAHARAQSAAVPMSEDDITVAFLPLAHVGERMIGHINRIFGGHAAAFAESIDKILDNIREIRPTFWGSVPRPYEKIHAAILAQVEGSSPLGKAIFNWGLKVGMEAQPYLEKQAPLPPFLKLEHALADKLVYGKIRNLFGGRCRFFVVGAAPIALEIERFFQALTLNMIPLYGMTEATGIITMNAPECRKIGTVGKALPDIDLKLAEDGELLARGPAMCKGYFKRDDDTETLIREGWLHTGDIATIDDEGYVRIVDRKKDILITAGGKNVAPQNIENHFKADPRISQMMVYGDRKKYLTALFTLNEDETTAYARGKGLCLKNFSELVKHPETTKMMDEIVREKNRDLAKFETIKKFVILPHDLTQEADEITPTMKVRRKIVTKKYGHLLDALYER